MGSHTSAWGLEPRTPTVVDALQGDCTLDFRRFQRSIATCAAARPIREGFARVVAGSGASRVVSRCVSFVRGRGASPQPCFNSTIREGRGVART